jgi:hypothetical protein
MGQLRFKDTFDRGGGPPYDETMITRVRQLETATDKTTAQMTSLETSMAVIRSNYATKADVSEAKNAIIMWVVSAILLAQILPMLLKKLGM